MAKVVKEYAFKDGRKGRQRYPWELWMNGQTWALEQGVDFDAKPISFANNAKSFAKRNDSIKEVLAQVEGTTVYVKAILLSEGEEISEDDDE